MLGENEFDGFFGFSDPSEVTPFFFSASRQSTTHTVSPIYFEQSLIHASKKSIFPQGNDILLLCPMKKFAKMKACHVQRAGR